MTGADQLRAMLADRIPSPPISRLTGMRISEVGSGTAAFTMPLTGWLLSPAGRISLGALTMPADGAVACAIQTELPPGTPLTTAELSLRVLTPVAPPGQLTARGRVIRVRRRIALSEVALLDQDDRLVAHGSSLCFLAPQISPLPDPPPLPEPSDGGGSGGSGGSGGGGDDGGAGGADPYARPVMGEVLPDDVWERMSGIELLRAQVAGELAQPPIHYLTGLELTEAAAGEATYTLPTTEWLCAPARRRVQGGAVALLGEAALSAAIQTTVPAGTRVAPVDLKVNYLRPLAADGRRAVARGRVVHGGRRIAVANAEVLDADGRPVAVATGSAMLRSIGTEA